MESNSEVLAVSVAKAAEMVGISSAMLYPRLMEGALRSFTIGSRRLAAVAWASERAGKVASTSAPTAGGWAPPAALLPSPATCAQS